MEFSLKYLLKYSWELKHPTRPVALFLPNERSWDEGRQIVLVVPSSNTKTHDWLTATCHKEERREETGKKTKKKHVKSLVRVLSVPDHPPD